MFENSRDSASEEVKHQRRLKAYQDMADLQVKEIIKQMISYSSTEALTDGPDNTMYYSKISHG